MKTKMLVMIALTTGCSSQDPAKPTHYDMSKIDTNSGLYELRAFFSRDECPAKKILPSNEAVPLIPGVILALADPFISAAVTAMTDKENEIGKSMGAPYPMTAYFFSGESDLSNAQCLMLGYGQYGGKGNNNITNNNESPTRYFYGTDMEKQLKSDLGFAMQIGIKRTNDNSAVIFTPYSLFYPAQLRPYGVNKSHSISISISFPKASVSIEMPQVKVGSALDQISLSSHKVEVNSENISSKSIGVTVVEGADNLTLSKMLTSLGDKSVADAISKSASEALKKKINNSVTGTANGG